MKESKLIFIISQPRSGSTLLQKLISNNSQVDTVSEPWLQLPLLSIYKPSLIKADYNYATAYKGFFDYLEKKDSKTEFNVLLKELILKLYKVSQPDQYFVDKTPRYYEIVFELYKMFPNSKFLVLKRNPFASLYSMITTWADSTLKPENFMTFYRDFLVGPFAIQEFINKNGVNENVLEVKYEEIVSNPKYSVKQMYDWLGIHFTDETLQIGRNEKVKGIYGDDVYKKESLNEVMDTNSDLWKKKLASDKYIESFFLGYQNFLTKEFIRQYGYTNENFKRNFSLFSKNQPFEELVSVLKKKGLI